jgi:hypothetical protein
MRNKSTAKKRSNDQTDRNHYATLFRLAEVNAEKTMSLMTDDKVVWLPKLYIPVVDLSSGEKYERNH